MMCFLLIYGTTKWICLIPFITLVFSTSNGDFASALSSLHCNIYLSICSFLYNGVCLGRLKLSADDVIVIYNLLSLLLDCLLTLWWVYAQALLMFLLFFNVGSPKESSLWPSKSIFYFGCFLFLITLGSDISEINHLYII